MSKYDEEKANGLMDKHHPMLVSVALKLSIGSETFLPKHLLSETTLANLSPLEWWDAITAKQYVPGTVGCFAKRLMVLAASSAGLERCFSALGNILTEKRSRLGIEKAEKLCSIFVHFNSTDSSEMLEIE